MIELRHRRVESCAPMTRFANKERGPVPLGICGERMRLAVKRAVWALHPVVSQGSFERFRLLPEGLLSLQLVRVHFPIKSAAQLD